MNHLFALPEIYNDRLQRVKASLDVDDEQSRASAELQEEAVAMIIFQFFEHALYQYQAAAADSNTDREVFLEEVLQYLTGRLLRNPRLRHYWDEKGGNCRVYFEDITKSWYDEKVQLRSGNSDYIDSWGPFPRPEPSWDIETKRTLSRSERENYWTHTHQEDDYQSVWSMTEDETVWRKVVSELDQVGAKQVLIPGCGSRGVLETKIIENSATVEKVFCTDFPGVIEVTRPKNTDSRIQYLGIDSTELSDVGTWDAVVVVNSVLSESHDENIEMMENFYTALAPGGSLIGFFPTIFCGLDIATSAGMPELRKNISLEQSSFFEADQGIWQIFYTPLRLRKILDDTRFTRRKFEIFFCDSPSFRRNSAEYYGLVDPDAHIYEHFIVADREPPAP